MKRLLALIVLLGVSLAMTPAPAVADAQPKRVLRHIVLYQFKPEVTTAQVQEVIDTFAALPKKIDTIIGFEHGLNSSQEGKSDGLTHAFQVTFRNEAGLKTYLEHPAHLDYVKVVKDRRLKVVVFDYWAEGK